MKLPALDWKAQIATSSGVPSPYFQRFCQQLPDRMFDLDWKAPIVYPNTGRPTPYMTLFWQNLPGSSVLDKAMMVVFPFVPRPVPGHLPGAPSPIFQRFWQNLTFP